MMAGRMLGGISWVTKWETFRNLVFVPLLIFTFPAGQLWQFPHHKSTFLFSGMDPIPLCRSRRSVQIQASLNVCMFFANILGMDGYLGGMHGVEFDRVF